MRIVAISTAHQLFFDRVPERAVGFGPDILVAVIAVSLFLKFILGQVCTVYGMTGSTGDVIVVVQAALPVFDVVLMTVDTHRILLCSRNVRISAERHHPGHINIAIHFKMLFTRPVTGLTTVFACSGGAWVCSKPVGGYLQITKPIIVALKAGLRSQVFKVGNHRMFARRARTAHRATF